MPKVLIIEDNDDLRDTLTMLLEDEGYSAVGACDGGEGVRVFKELRPDLVLTDLIMPGGGGIEAIRQIRAIEPGVRIIAMSGGSLIGRDTDLRMAQKLGAMAVLSKPFEVEDLVQEVARCLISTPSDMAAPGSEHRLS